MRICSFSLSCLSLPFHSIYGALLETHKRKSNRKCDLLMRLNKLAIYHTNCYLISCQMECKLCAKYLTSCLLLKEYLQVAVFAPLKDSAGSPFHSIMYPSPFFVLLNCNLSLSAEHSVYLHWLGHHF